MNWNGFRVVCHAPGHYQIMLTRLGPGGAVIAYGERGPKGDSLEALRADVEAMRAALDQPVLYRATYDAVWEKTP